MIPHRNITCRRMPRVRLKSRARKMLDLIAHNIAPIMFISVMAMLLLGYPVAFSLPPVG